MSPTQSQLQAAESLVDALDLTQGAALFWHVVYLSVPSDSVPAHCVAGCSLMQPGSLMLHWTTPCKIAAMTVLLWMLLVYIQSVRYSLSLLPYSLFPNLEPPVLHFSPCSSMCFTVNTILTRQCTDTMNMQGSVCSNQAMQTCYKRTRECLQMVLSICNLRPQPTPPCTASSPSWLPELSTRMLACQPKTCRCSTPSAAPLATRLRPKLPSSNCPSNSLSSSR